MIENLIATRANCMIHFGRPGGMRRPPGGDLGEVKRLGQRLRHILCSNSLLRTWQLWQKRHPRLGIRHAVPDHAIALKGRAADCLPQGGTPPPARLFLTAPWESSVLSLTISATSATLICTIVFGTVFFSRLSTDMRNCVADSVLLECFGVILEGLEPSWAALGVS